MLVQIDRKETKKLSSSSLQPLNYIDLNSVFNVKCSFGIIEIYVSRLLNFDTNCFKYALDKKEVSCNTCWFPS